MVNGEWNGNLLNEHLHAAAVIATTAILEMSHEGPLPRSEITVKIGGKLNLGSFGRGLMKVLQFQLPNLVAFPTPALVSYAAAYMGVVFELTKATQESLQLVLDLPQRHALLSYLAHFNALGKGIFAAKTDKQATLSTSTHMRRLTCAFSIPLPPTIVRIKLGVPHLKPIVFPASLKEIDAMPGVRVKRDFWALKLGEREDRPYCRGCNNKYRNKGKIAEHLLKTPACRRARTGALLKNVTNREVVDCAMRHLDPSQKEAIELVFLGYHLLLLAPAGYGKTEVLKCLKEVGYILFGERGYARNMAICAPTNVQAANLDTVTFNAHWGIGIGEIEMTAEELYQRFLKSRAPKITASQILLVSDEVFKQQAILGEFQMKAMLHGCPMGTQNPFEVPKRLPAGFLFLFLCCTY